MNDFDAPNENDWNAGDAEEAAPDKGKKKGEEEEEVAPKEEIKVTDFEVLKDNPPPKIIPEIIVKPGG
jgi:hypothetical protein